MSEVPWWAHSPSPMTLGIYTVLALYGAYKLESKTPRQWLHNFCESAFVIGLIILPFDCGWQIFQWFKFGYLYPDEIKIVFTSYVRNIAIYALCLLSSWKLAEKTRKLDIKKSLVFLVPIFTLLITFLISPDPAWTDWTYAFRFPEISSTSWLTAYLIGIPIRIMTSLAYVGLWKGNFVAKR
jgi:hypothetical protein